MPSKTPSRVLILPLFSTLVPAPSPELSKAVQEFFCVRDPKTVLTHVRIIGGAGAPAIEDQNLEWRHLPAKGEGNWLCYYGKECRPCGDQGKSVKTHFGHGKCRNRLPRWYRLQLAEAVESGEPEIRTVLTS